MLFHQAFFHSLFTLFCPLSLSLSFFLLFSSSAFPFEVYHSLGYGRAYKMEANMPFNLNRGPSYLFHSTSLNLKRGKAMVRVRSLEDTIGRAVTCPHET